jgi:hypothetical protein
MKSAQTFSPCFCNIHSNTIFHLSLGLPSGHFPSGHPTRIFYVFLISPTRDSCLTHSIIFHFITLIIFGEVYKCTSSSFCSFLYPPATSSPLGPNMLLSTLFSCSQTLSIYFHPLMSETKFHAHKKQQRNFFLILILRPYRM